MPTYYATQFGLDVGHSAALSVLPWGLNVVCANAAGYIGDKVCSSPFVQSALRLTCYARDRYILALKSSHRQPADWSTCVQMLNDWGVDRTLTRKAMQAFGSMGPAACLFALAADQGADRACVCRHVLHSSVTSTCALLAIDGQPQQLKYLSAVV
jgi:hypothetical protein